MKPKIYPTKSALINATRIEVFHQLAEKFSTPYPELKNAGKSALEKPKFNADRLFNVIHRN